MKSTIKIFLVVALFSSITLADDGNMSNGGFTDDGNMSNGGKTCTQNCLSVDQTTRDTETNSFLESVQEYLTEIFG